MRPFVVFLFDLVDELPHEVEDAVPRPRLLPEIGGRAALAGGRHGRIAGAAELPLIEGKEARLGASELRGDVDQIRVPTAFGAGFGLSAGESLIRAKLKTKS